jgi:chromosome segregation ATPase
MNAAHRASRTGCATAFSSSGCASPVGATKKTPRKRSPAETPTGRVTILLEQIQEQNRATIEAVFASEQRIRRDFDARFSSLEQRVAALEVAVRKNSEDIQELKVAVRKNSEDIQELKVAVRENSEDIQELKRSVDEVRAAMAQKMDAAQLAALEARVAHLETRLGIES